VKTRSCPPGRYAATAVAALWLLLLGMLDATSGMAVIPLLIVAPLIVAAAADERRTAIFAGATVALAIAAGSRHDPVEQVNYWLGRHSHDDVALLLLEYGAYPHSGATGIPRPGRRQDAGVPAESPARKSGIAPPGSALSAGADVEASDGLFVRGLQVSGVAG